MISARNFCSATRTSGLTNMNSIVEHITTENNTKNIIILPLASGNRDQDSGTQNIPDNFDNCGAIFEPVGELEVDDFVNSSSETEEEDD